MRRAVLRAVDLGRSLSLDVMAGSHFHSQKTLIALEDKFGSDPLFEAMVIDNSGDRQSAQPFAIDAGVEYIWERQYSDLDDLEKQALNTFHEVCDEYQRKEGR